MTPLAILNARLVDPVAGEIRKGGLLVRDRHIAAVGAFDLPEGCETIDAKGACLAPGLVDVGSFAIDMKALDRKSVV
jgi:dihydroorotase